MKIIITESQLKTLINEGSNTITSDGISKGVNMVKILMDSLRIGEKDAAAIAGNIWQESHFNPGALEKHPDGAKRVKKRDAKSEWDEILNKSFEDGEKVYDLTKGGYGLIQWTATRRRDLEDFLSKWKQHPGGILPQLSFLRHELNGTEKSKWKEVLGKDSVEDKAKEFHLRIERSASKDSTNRMDAARKIYDEYLKTKKSESEKPKRNTTYKSTYQPTDYDVEPASTTYVYNPYKN